MPAIRLTPDAVTCYDLEIAPETVLEIPEWLQRFIQSAAGITGLGAEAVVGYCLGIYVRIRRDNPDQAEQVIREKFLQSLTHPSRRDFICGSVAAGGIVAAFGCGPMNQLLSTFAPPTATPTSAGALSPSVAASPTAVPTSIAATPEGFQPQSIRQAVTAFREADKIPPPYPNEREVVAIGESHPVTLRVKRWGEDELEIGPQGNAMKVKFLPDRVAVLLPVDSFTVSVNGIATIVEIDRPQFVNYVVQQARAKGLMTDQESIQYPAAASSGAALRGHAILVNVLPRGDEWIMLSPWLTNKNVVSNWKSKGQEIAVHYKLSDGQEVEVPLSSLMARGKTFAVSVDGRYTVDGKSYGRILQGRGVDARVIDAYEELFIPPILKGEWSSRKEGSDTYHDAAQAYWFVGSKNDEHAHLLDLQMGTLNVGVMVKEDLIALPLTLKREGENVSVERDPRKLLALKEKYGALIMNNQGEMAGVQEKLMAVRREIRNNKDWADEIDRNGYRNFFVIVQAGAIAQVIRRRRDESGREILERFMWDEGKLVTYAEYQKTKAAKEGRTVKPEDLEFQLYSKSPLEVRDGKFWQDGKEVILVGGNSPHFADTFFLRNTAQTVITSFKNDVNYLKQAGGNTIAIQINSGDEWLGNKVYLESLLTAIEYAKSLGLFVTLTIRFRGKDINNPNWGGDINVVDRQLVLDWEKLLQDPEVAARIGAGVDIFNPSSEPKFPSQTDRRLMTWDQLKPIYDQVASVIRAKTGKQNAIIALAPPDRAADVKQLVEKLNSGQSLGLGPNDVIDTHPYIKLGHDTYNVQKYIPELVARQIPIIAGEIGWNNPLWYTDDILKLLTRLRVGFIVHVLASYSNNESEGILVLRSGKRTNAYWLTSYYSRPNK